MSKLVCVGVSDGDMVQATPGSGLYPPATSGSWTAGPVIYTDAAKITVNGSDPVSLEAECTFTFNGVQTPPGTPVVGTSKVTLTPPATTKLKDNGSNVLRLDDTNSDSYGNTLTVVSGSNTKLKSA